MRGAGIFLCCLVGFATSHINVPHQPHFDVRQAKSPFGIPSIEITFSNGVRDSLVLERFYPSEQSRMERQPSCNFFGHLENEKSACVSVTGCPGQDDMAFTINSRNGGSTHMYILHKDGHLELVESAFKDERVTSGSLRVPKRKNGFHSDRDDDDEGDDETDFHSDGDDEMIDEDEVADQMKFEALCASGDCSSMPAKQKMEIKIHYDDTFKADTSDVSGYLNGMVTHLQTHFCHSSLGTQIKVEVIDTYTHHSGQTWKAESSSGSLQGPIKAIAAADTSGADLNVFMCKDQAFYGVVGLAWVGTMCKTSWKGYNAGVNEKRGNVLSTSEVVAHEMGHNMGMLHDFDDQHGGSGGACDGTGIMSYGSAPNQWSTCSKNDFLALYNQIIASSSWNWCLEDEPSACGGGTNPTTAAPTTAAPTTAPPSTGCDASKNDWGCCTSSNPCDVGEGDCDKDSECTGNSVCGTNNCKNYDSAWSSSGFDCCETGCDASKNDWGCCSSSNTCAAGEGDCDNDSDCAGNLVCGKNNCKYYDSAWSSSSFDCCTEAGGCDASKNDWSCCTSSNPCDVGEGDCDTDSECTGNLVCGTNNCKNYDSAWSSSGFDCCETGCDASKNDWACCTSSNPCGVNEGDCDKDSDCAGELVCGKNNCKSSNSAWSSSSFDCCTVSDGAAEVIGDQNADDESFVN